MPSTYKQNFATIYWNIRKKKVKIIKNAFIYLNL